MLENNPKPPAPPEPDNPPADPPEPKESQTTDHGVLLGRLVERMDGLDEWRQQQNESTQQTHGILSTLSTNVSKMMEQLTEQGNSRVVVMPPEIPDKTEPDSEQPDESPNPEKDAPDADAGKQIKTTPPAQATPQIHNKPTGQQARVVHRRRIRSTDGQMSI